MSAAKQPGPLSDAQRALLLSAEARAFGMVNVRGTRTAEALVRRGYLSHRGASLTMSCGTTFVITDAGRAAIAKLAGSAAAAIAKETQR